MRSGYADQNFNFSKTETLHCGRRYLPTISSSFPLYLIWQNQIWQKNVQYGRMLPTFQRNILLPSSALKMQGSMFCQNSYPSTKLHDVTYLWRPQSLTGKTYSHSVSLCVSGSAFTISQTFICYIWQSVQIQLSDASIS